MTDLKEIIVDSMYDSMKAYVDSKEYIEEEYAIQNMIQKLRQMLSLEAGIMLNVVLDMINDSDRRYSEEAYYRGIIASIIVK